MKLVTLVLKDIALPLGYYSIEEAEKIKQQILETNAVHERVEGVIIA